MNPIPRIFRNQYSLGWADCERQHAGQIQRAWDSGYGAGFANGQRHERGEVGVQLPKDEFWRKEDD